MWKLVVVCFPPLELSVLHTMGFGMLCFHFHKCKFFLTSSVTYCLVTMNLHYFSSFSCWVVVPFYYDQKRYFICFVICSVAFNNWRVQKKMLWTENMYSAVIMWNVLQMSVKYISCITQFDSNVTCFSCLDNPSVDERGVLKFPTTSSICFLNLGAPTLGAYIYNPIFLLFILYYTCVYMCACMGTCMCYSVCVEVRWEPAGAGSFLLHVGPGDWTQVISLGSKWLFDWII